MNVYVFGIVGFIIGFLCGQWLLAKILKDRTKEELLNDPKLKDYGFITWGLAILFCVLFVFLGKATEISS